MAEPEDPQIQLPREPIYRLVGPLERFLHVEAASGVVLLLCAIAALILANSSLSEQFLGLWEIQVGFTLGSFEVQHTLKHWINDGLMAVFFFVIGLEVKRELVIGELRDLRTAALPIAAAIGGMVVPAGIYLALQGGKPGQSGWGIPMATDIAFVIGCLAILGNRVPLALRLMLVSLAIADDIGAILVIAIGYTESIDGTALMLGFVGIGVIAVLARVGVRALLVYAVAGFLVWLAFHESGVHATIAGVILGLQTPARSYGSGGLISAVLDRASHVFHGDGWESVSDRATKVRKFQHVVRESISPVEYLEGLLHPWVGFVIMPIFALANAGVPLRLSDLGEPISVAVGAGLVVGKPLGILVFSWVAVRVGLARLPQGVGWGVIVGGGFLAGIGFTMALFISGLALDGDALNTAKVGILGASAVAGITGVGLLVWLLPGPRP